MGGPGGVDEADINQIAKMRAILIPKRSEFHANEGREGDDLEVEGTFGFRHVGGGEGIFGADELSRDENMHRFPGRGTGAVEKHIDALRAPVDEADGFERGAGMVQIFPPEKNINVARVADGGAVHARDPFGDRVSAGGRIWNPGGLQAGRRLEQSFADLFHGTDLSFPSGGLEGVGGHGN